MKSAIERFFKLKESKTDIKTEVLAGVTTFMAMAYILASIPKTMADPAYIMGNAALGAQIENAVFIAVCISSFIGTMLMAFLANLPFVLGPGIGITATFAYTLMLGMGYSYAEGLGVVFISGILFIIISALGLREAIVKALPHNINVAISAGIGLFIAFIGMVNGGIVVNNDATLVSVVNFSDFSVGSPARDAIVCLAGLTIIAYFSCKKIKGGILIAILGATLVGIPLEVTEAPSNFSMDIATMFHDYTELSFGKCFTGLQSMFAGSGFFEAVSEIFVVIITISMIDMFDTIGTLIGAAQGAGMMDEKGEVKNMKRALLSDAMATACGAVFGSSTITTFTESSSGVAEGGRTGLTSVVAALLFLVSIVLAPFIGIVPIAAVSPAMIYIGVLMISSTFDRFDFSTPDEAIPAFLTMAVMPLTYGIANGIAFGIISYVIAKIISGKAKELNPTIIILAVLFTLRYAMIA